MVHLLQENYVVWGPGVVLFFNHYPFFSCLPRLTSSIHFRSLTLAAMVCPSLEQKELRQREHRARPPQEVPTAEWRAHPQSVVQATALSAPRTSVASGELFQDQKPGAFITSKKKSASLESGKSSSHNCPMSGMVPCRPVQSWNHDLLLIALNHRSEAPGIPSILL